METKITSESRKAEVTTESTLSDLFVNITANYRQEAFIDKGKETQQILGTTYITGQKQIQFSLETLSDLESVDLKKLVEEAIADAKSKH